MLYTHLEISVFRRPFACFQKFYYRSSFKITEWWIDVGRSPSITKWDTVLYDSPLLISLHFESQMVVEFHEKKPYFPCLKPYSSSFWLHLPSTTRLFSKCREYLLPSGSVRLPSSVNNEGVSWSPLALQTQMELSQVPHSTDFGKPSAFSKHILGEGGPKFWLTSRSDLLFPWISST